MSDLQARRELQGSPSTRSTGLKVIQKSPHPNTGTLVALSGTVIPLQVILPERREGMLVLNQLHAYARHPCSL